MHNLTAVQAAQERAGRSATSPIPVLHLVQRFYVGGAERQFIERLRAHPEGFEPVVGCLEVSGGNLADFRALGWASRISFPSGDRSCDSTPPSRCSAWRRSSGA